MAETSVSANILVRVPDDVEVRLVTEGPVRRGVPRGMKSTLTGTSELLAALSSANFDISAEVELVPRGPGTRAFRRSAQGPAEIDVTVDSDESALLLVESAGGVYAWLRPDGTRTGPAGRRSRLRRTLVFFPRSTRASA